MQQLPRLAVHKFTSCDGCQLALLNAGENLLILNELVEIVHFAEAGKLNLDLKVDFALIEGSISTPEEELKIKKIRQNSKYLIAIGACATAGGIQALRNFYDSEEWVAEIYPQPEYIQSLKTSSAIAQYVKVDLELWGCPVNTEQVLGAIRSLLFAAPPKIKNDAVCIECKKQGNICVMVVNQATCLGPVTKAGCGAICPAQGRACYGCYGPSENPNPKSLSKKFTEFGATDEDLRLKFWQINNQAPAFYAAGNYFKGIKIEHEK